MKCGDKGWKSWLMTLGCLLPLIILIAAPALGFNSKYLTLLAFLVCPLSMVIMMFMNKDKEKCH